MKSLKIISLVALLSMGGQVFGISSWFGSKFSNLFGRSVAKQQVAQRIALGMICGNLNAEGGLSDYLDYDGRPSPTAFLEYNRRLSRDFSESNILCTMRKIQPKAQMDKEKYCASWGEWFLGKKSSSAEVYKCNRAKRMLKTSELYLSTIAPIHEEISRCNNQECISQAGLKKEQALKILNDQIEKMP